MPRHNTTTVVVQDVAVVKHCLLLEQGRRGCRDRKVTEDYYWIGVQENISDVTKSSPKDDDDTKFSVG